jgi:aminoglycoside phosphotransferase family enzyme/predicted kinase
VELRTLIDALSKPSAYPLAVGKVDVRQTHISVVFLVGDYVYKIKKPVDLGFLDFSSLEKRRYYCEQEVRLNRRLAPDVYLGLVPVVSTGATVQMEGSGEIIEWAVKMRRLPDAAQLHSRLKRGEVNSDIVERLAQKLAAFYARADSSLIISSFGEFEVVARNALDNFVQATPQVTSTLSPAVLERLRKLTENELDRCRTLIEQRARRAMPRDTHGDLRLDHIYFFPERLRPADFTVIDCVEFNERYRFADPVADIAFLAMEFKSHGRGDLARAFSSAYFRAAHDEEAEQLLPFYTSYRAAVRAKVEGMKVAEAEVPEADRTAAALASRQLWLLSLSELEVPIRRPCLVLIGGLPGTGKSTLSADLAACGNFEVIRSDIVRKELAGRSEVDSAAQPFGTGIYAPAWNERTYRECLSRAEARLFAGQRVIVDASFRENSMRRVFLDAAKQWGVPVLFLRCEADSSKVRDRIAHRHNDASDADWAIYLKALESWEPTTDDTQAALRIIPADGTPEQTAARAREVLKSLALL